MLDGQRFSTTGNRHSRGVFLDRLFRKIGQGPDNVELSPEYRLVGHHGADLPAVKHIDQQRLDNIIPVMGQGDLVASLFGGNLEDPFAPQAGAEKTGILLVEIAVRQGAVVRSFR